MVMTVWPTAQMVSLAKWISLTTPLAVEGILATNLSVNTSHRSSYYRLQLPYLFNLLPHLHEDLFDRRFLCALAQIRQLDFDHREGPHLVHGEYRSFLKQSLH
jgi:hypothetical protein